MKRQFTTSKSVRNCTLFLLLLTCTLAVSGQQASTHILPRQTVKVPNTFKFNTKAPMRSAHSEHSQVYSPAPATSCDTDLFMDYAAYDQVIAETQGLNYDGSWYNGTQLYANGITSYITKASGDSGYISYAGVVFDSLLFSNPLDTASGYLPLASSTVYFDSLAMYTALTGDSTRMTTDSIIVLIYSITNGTFSATPVKTIVYKGWTQLKQFYAYGGYVASPVVPVHYQFTQGQGMAVLLEYHNKHTGNILSLLYSYADSCGTVTYQGSSIPSPAYPPVLPGNEFYGSINADTTGIVDYGDNTYGYFGAGFSTNCSYVYNQNWAIMPIVTVCTAVAAPAATATSTNVNCYGQSTGTATAAATGGDGTFTYIWSNGATTSSVSNLPAGNYTVTVTSNGQTVTATTTVSQPASALVTAPSATQTACSPATGTASANATGGTTAYTYSWSNSATGATITGLAANTYHVTVTDSKGCTATGSATVSAPAPFSVSVSVTNVNCFGSSTGSATATTTGSTGNLTYAWTSGNTETVNNLGAGNYNVTVTDANGCTGSATATISQPATAVTASATSTQTSCASATGTATVTAGGGTAGYTYSWSNSGTTTTISNLGVGNYNVTVTDAKSCTATATASVNTSATFIINVTSTNVNCYGQSTGSASANATGTTGNVTYVWSNTSTTQNISSLPAGTYNVTVTDGSGCPKTNSVNVAQPGAALTASLTTAPTNCTSNTGTATATVNGGTTAYSYAWSNSSTTSTASGLAVGNVSLTVTDNNGCTTTASGTISLPPVFTVSANSTPASCNGQTSGSVTATPSGVGNYTYSWSNGGTSATIANVAAAQYTVTVTDGFGCTVTASSSVSQPSAVLITVTPTDATNGNNGTASASVTGGTSPYQYNWSNQATSDSISGLAAGNYTVTVTDSNNCSGTATVTIVATGINNVIGNITNITLIPNPATDQVKVEVSLGTAAQTVEFRLVDVTGKYIYTAHESTVQGNVIHQINLSEYASGIYLVEIAAGNETVRKKLVITK